MKIWKIFQKDPDTHLLDKLKAANEVLIMYHNDTAIRATILDTDDKLVYFYANGNKAYESWNGIKAIIEQK